MYERERQSDGGRGGKTVGAREREVRERGRERRRKRRRRRKEVTSVHSRLAQSSS